MRIAISSKNDDLLSQIDTDFEKAHFYIILNPKNCNTYECILNPNRGRIRKKNCATFILCNRHVDAVLTGHCSADTLKDFKASGIKVYQGYSGKILPNVKKLISQQSV